MSLSDLQRQSKHSYHSNNLKIILDGNRVTLFKKLVVSWIRFVRYMLDYAHEKTNQMKMLNVMKLAAVKYGIPFLCPALKSPIEKWKGQTASWANFLRTTFRCNIARHYYTLRLAFIKHKFLWVGSEIKLEKIFLFSAPTCVVDHKQTISRSLVDHL